MGTLDDVIAGRIEQPDSPPEFRTMFADSYAGRVNDHAKWVLKDICDPLSNGDHMQELTETILDDTHDLRVLMVAALKSQDDCDLGKRFRQWVQNKANDYAYSEARREVGDE